MPNFTLRPTSDVATVPWEDPALGERASRVNPSAVAPHRHFVVPAHEEVEVTVTPDGAVEGALDSALAGNVFVAWFAEVPGDRGLWPIITQPAGQSTVQRFTPHKAGHYTLVVRRLVGGAVIFHVDVEPPT